MNSPLGQRHGWHWLPTLLWWRQIMRRTGSVNKNSGFLWASYL